MTRAETPAAGADDAACDIAGSDTVAGLDQLPRANPGKPRITVKGQHLFPRVMLPVSALTSRPLASRLSHPLKVRISSHRDDHHQEATQMSDFLNSLKLKEIVITQWRLGGMETLIKVMPKGSMPTSGRMTGWCTSFKFVVGRTPLEMEAILGLAPSSKLAFGADIFLVRPLPTATQFELGGYTQTPEGLSTDDLRYKPDSNYPPGLGAPQWSLSSYPQTGLRHLAAVNAGNHFRYMVASLPHPL